MMRLGPRILTVLLSLWFVGDPVHGELCQPAFASCADAQSKPMNCCQPGHCCCDLSTPSQPMPGALPARAVSATGHEVARMASLPAAVGFFISGERSGRPSTGDTHLPQFAVVAPYALTHAFLI